MNLTRTRLDDLRSIWLEARHVHLRIITQEDEDFESYLSNEFSRLQVVFEDTRDLLLEILGEINVPSNITTRSESPVANSSEIVLCGAKLPKLDLPTFSGEYEDWENFCDLFTSLVDNRSIADSAKLQYLKQCLRGTAADLVKEVTITNANYAPTWQALKDRFYKPWQIIVKHLRSLINLPYLKRESPGDLRCFADESQRIVRALKNLKLPVEHWDTWFVFHLADRLDPESRKLWESEFNVNDRKEAAGPLASNILKRVPKFDTFAEFLEARAQTLVSAAESGLSKGSGTSSSKNTPAARRVHYVESSRPPKTAPPKCTLCSGAHPIHKCHKFQAKSVYERRAEVRRLHLCFNCLGTHKFNQCPSIRRCVACNEKHHSMLHFETSRQPGAYQQRTNDSDKTDTGKSTPNTGVTILAASIVAPRRSVILATAQLLIIGPSGHQTRVRALLDQGSETSCISESMATLLNLPRKKVHVPLNGVGTSGACIARFATYFTLQSLTETTFKIGTNALILPRLTTQLPARRLIELDLDIFRELTLADPNFHTPDSVDVLLGADIYGQLLRSGLRQFPSTSLTAQDTVFGWIISGPVSKGSSRRAETFCRTPTQTLHCVMHNCLDETLQRFWRLEELPMSAPSLSPEETACETLFAEKHSRDSDGRYIIQLPLKTEPPAIGSETLQIALKSLSHIQHRFETDSQLASAYRDFMATYEELGHMQRIPESEIDNEKAWYLPHHAIMQGSALCKKIRVVFDASRKTRAGHSLNDFLMPGPALQRDLALILLNWRKYRFVFTADIVKMFRQIRVLAHDQDLQRIVWAPRFGDRPVHYRLTTVTYGTTCAPYLAIRTLLQLAQDEKSRYPLGASCLESNTYVDDTFAGADELSVAMQTKQELIGLLMSAGIKLDKWAANHPELSPPMFQPSRRDCSKQIEPDLTVKTLGIRWDPHQDEFSFTAVNIESLVRAPTKRTILSRVAQLFDPLGWLTPITLEAKKLMQDLWILKYGWDDPLTGEIHDRWQTYCTSLASLQSISIKRWFGVPPGLTSQIHGFSDASSRAYSATVYLRTEDVNGNFRISMLAARSKIAPVKTISIPNLELCGAALLTKLVQYVKELDFLQNLPVYAWTDSKIVLMWLRKHPCHWKTFVANRVSFIQTELTNVTWAHVPSKENPTDLASRGSTPIELAKSDLWWYGPKWLSQTSDYWHQEDENLLVLHAHATSEAQIEQAPSLEPELLTKYSSLDRLVRVVAFCLRPLNKLRRRQAGLEPLPEFLTTLELHTAQTVIIKLAQASAFACELDLLQKGRPLPKRNPLNKVNPFVDKDHGILRPQLGAKTPTYTSPSLISKSFIYT